MKSKSVWERINDTCDTATDRIYQFIVQPAMIAIYYIVLIIVFFVIGVALAHKAISSKDSLEKVNDVQPVFTDDSSYKTSSRNPHGYYSVLFL